MTPTAVNGVATWSLPSKTASSRHGAARGTPVTATAITVASRATPADSVVTMWQRAGSSAQVYHAVACTTTSSS